MNKAEDKKPALPEGWHSYDLEVIKFIDHLEIMLPVIRQHYIDAVELQDITIQSSKFEEVLTMSSELPADPVGMIATDPRRKQRREHMTKTRSLIKKIESSFMEVLHFSAKASIE
mgnify:FL=1